MPKFSPVLTRRLFFAFVLFAAVKPNVSFSDSLRNPLIKSAQSCLVSLADIALYNRFSSLIAQRKILQYINSNVGGRVKLEVMGSQKLICPKCLPREQRYIDQTVGEIRPQSIGLFVYQFDLVETKFEVRRRFERYYELLQNGGSLIVYNQDVSNSMLEMTALAIGLGFEGHKLELATPYREVMVFSKPDAP